MGTLGKLTLGTILVLILAVVLVLICLIIPVSLLLELFLVSMGGMLVVGIALLILWGLSKIIDLQHRNQVQQEFRMLELQRRQLEYALQRFKHRRMTRGRGPYN
ncbi:MAG: hypothetical protein ACXWOL_05305 [Ktedonobacteraceae bacterium]